MWQGDGNVLREITSMINEAFSGASNTRQQEIAEKVSELTENSEFPCYLLSILISPSLNLNLRLAAGHTLKSTLEKKREFPLPILAYLQENIINSLSDSSISSAVINIASTLYITQEGWPQLLQYLSLYLESQTCLMLLVSLFEDISTYSALAYLLDTPQYSETLKNIIIQLFDLAPTNNILAFKVLNQLIKIMPTCMMSLTSKYLEILINVPLSDVVAEGIFNLTCSRKDVVKKNFAECARAMITYMNSEKGALACNFWMEFISETSLVLPYLHELLFNVLGCLKMTENDMMLMMPENEEFRFEKEENDRNWSKRRESAILLDNLSQSFGGECFMILKDPIQGLLLSPDWVSIESGLLGLGALAPGASGALLPSLPTFLPFLLQQTAHSEKLVVAMSLWTISRFTDFIISTHYFQPYLESIIKSMMVQENIIQQAACTSFCILISRNPEELHGYIDNILQIFSQCLDFYKGKALVNLLDAISSVGDILGEGLKQEKYVPLLFTPIFNLWTRTKNTERLMWTLCESICSVILAMQDLLQPYMQQLFNRCCELISQGLAGNEKQFAVKALELAGVVIENSVQLECTEIFPLLDQCLDEKDISVKQYAAATCGDLVFKKVYKIESCISLFIPKLIRCLCVIEGPDDISSLFSLTCNNSACALAEIALNYPSQVFPFLPEILSLTIDCAKKTHIPQVKANLFCCVGKFGNVSPDILGKDLGGILRLWSEMMSFPLDHSDKEASFNGIALALQSNINALDQNFQYFTRSVLDFQQMSELLKGHIKQVLTLAKGLAGGNWEAYVSQLPFRQELLVSFQV